ncbi:hypothetical protein [Salinactinospora qingdaonensis]
MVEAAAAPIAGPQERASFRGHVPYLRLRPSQVEEENTETVLLVGASKDRGVAIFCFPRSRTPESV